MSFLYKKNLSLLIILLFLVFSPIKIFALVDINTASLIELDKITQIGAITAQKIIDARPYKVIDDLLKVKGIGEKTLLKIKEQALICVNCSTPTPIPVPTPEPSSPVIPSLTGNLVVENTQNILDSRVRENDTTIPTTILPVIYPDGVIINEILPSPQGADEENEYIELYNKNNFDVDLSGWKLKDSDGTITTYIIPGHLPDGRQAKILANSFLIFKRPDTKISLNNAKDSITLLFPNNKITSSVSFIKAPINQSYSKINDNYIWNTNLTPEKPNIVLTDLSKSNNSDNNNSIITENLASLSNSLNSNTNKNLSNKNPLLLFVIVLCVAIILSTIILVIKIKIKK